MRRRNLWLVAPQVVSRLASVLLFAFVANVVDARDLGAFALASAFSALPVALGPAIVGKPLAAMESEQEGRSRSRDAEGAAILLALAVGAAFAVAALLASGPVALALLGGALGVPGAMAIEASFWRLLIADGPRAAALVSMYGYGGQTLLTSVACLLLRDDLVIVAPFAAIFALALPLMAAHVGSTVTGARDWLLRDRALWMPYVVGVGAAVSVVQAIPITLSATNGLASATTYRAGELSFGLTNLFIGVVSQSLLVDRTHDVLAKYRKASLLLAGVALANGLAVFLTPEALLAIVVGEAAPGLHHNIPIFTLQRTALCVSAVGTILIIGRIPARRAGTIDVVGATFALTALLVGCLVSGITAGLLGLAVVETALAVYFRTLIVRAAKADPEH